MFGYRSAKNAHFVQKSKKIRLNEVKYLLVTWGNVLAHSVSESNLPSATTIYRCIELGAQGAAIRCTFPVSSNYWPNSELIQINNAIQELDNINRNILVLRFILGHSYKEIGDRVGMSKTGVIRRMPKIESEIHSLLQ